ncbi:hypothetical protein [Derxia gummosa]|uniref:Uncharacterized protein n=1 Tax=Derxia gummosa DSM 723 TaxID=1121388 RepID=A0A8B6X389_9BURK|nr:hypothetical protein [Derxia gummosa]
MNIPVRSQRATRDTLKRFFGANTRPNAGHFSTLIDSMLNMEDEGFSKHPKRGLEVRAAPGENTLFSLYRPGDVREQPRWQIGHLNGESLGIQACHEREASSVLTLSGDAESACRVAVGAGATGRAVLAVDGRVEMDGRLGRAVTDLPEPPLADGRWHAVTGDLQGCQAFEVMAVAGNPGRKRYALMHALCINTFHPRTGLLDWLWRRRGIRITDNWYGRRCGRLELRWTGSHGTRGQYRLEVRSGCDYGDGTVIRVHLTKLWFDDMKPEA